MLNQTAAAAYSRRDFWLCLARAFASPGTGEDYLAAFQSDLPEDLLAIGAELGLRLDAEVADFRAAASGIANPLELQKLYAALFLTPPTPVMVNTCFYIDGGIQGAAAETLERAYDAHGFRRHEHFRDLNDTVGVQADFLALLYERAAQKAEAGEMIDARAYLAQADQIIADYPSRWITPFLRDLEQVSRDHAVNPVYAHLARIVWLAVESAIQAPEIAEIKEGLSQLPQGSARGIGALTAEDLAEIAYMLDRDGLSWDHVAVNEGWDDAVFEARLAKGDRIEAVH
jgi:TorA maturation chaperone TorD